MKKYVFITITVVALIGGLVWFNNQRDSKEIMGAATQSLTFASVQQDVKSGAKLYDVRTASEYSAGHFEGATNWSLQDMQANNLPDVAKDAKVYVYCRSGNRSGQAMVILKNAGYTNVTDLKGLTDVESLGGKLVTN